MLSGDHILKKDTVVTGSIQSVKGFEFCMVVVIGCTDRKFPPTRTHKDELWRNAFRLYVAITRA
jgi:superfamily I DNA/RNA helicase